MDGGAMGLTWDSHLDAGFCMEMGEQLAVIPVGANILMKSNGQQGNVYRNVQTAEHLRRLGCVTARDLLVQGVLHPTTGVVDLLVMIHYPKRSHADPPNLWPTVKHLEDGMTDAGLWTDDDSTHIRRHIFQHHPNPTGVKGLWRFEFHIIPIGEDQ